MNLNEAFRFLSFKLIEYFTCLSLYVFFRNLIKARIVFFQCFYSEYTIRGIPVLVYVNVLLELCIREELWLP